jgi:predicted AAA+ superfamily ATPase
MAFVSGPYQVGKTTLAKTLPIDSRNYFNWDQARFRMIWSKDPELLLPSCGDGPIVFDKIHNDKRWKQRIKGLFDTLESQMLHASLF